MNADFDTGKVRAEKIKEACEMEDRFKKEQLTESLAGLGSMLAGVREGDRKSMLALLELTANALLVPDSLQPEVQADLANGLKEAVNRLRQSQGFLPRGRGKHSEEENQEYKRIAVLTSMRVEFLRRKLGVSTEKAKGKVAEDWGMSEGLVNKHWNYKKAYLDARRVFEAIESALAICRAHES